MKKIIVGILGTRAKIRAAFFALLSSFICPSAYAAGKAPLFNFEITDKKPAAQIEMFRDDKSVVKIVGNFDRNGEFVKSLEYFKGAEMATANQWASFVVMKKNAESKAMEILTINVANGKLERAGIVRDYLSKGFGPNGNLVIEMPSRDGKIDGLTKHFYENGQVKSEYTIKGGKLHGTQRDYFENGRLKFETEWDKGAPVKGSQKVHEDSGKAEDERVAQEKEKAEFEVGAKKYRALKKKPRLPKEAHKFAVQAEDATSEKKYDEACELYKQALAIAPWWSQGRYNRAHLLAETHHHTEAITEMERYLQLEPRAKDAAEAQDQIYRWERKAGK